MDYSLYLLNSVVDFALFVRKPTSFLNKTPLPSCNIAGREASHLVKGREMPENGLFFSEIPNVHSLTHSKIPVECHCVPSTAQRILCREDRVPTSLSFGPNRTYTHRTGRWVMCQVAGASGANKPRPDLENQGDVIAETLKSSEWDSQTAWEKGSLSKGQANAKPSKEPGAGALEIKLHGGVQMVSCIFSPCWFPFCYHKASSSITYWYFNPHSLRYWRFETVFCVPTGGQSISKRSAAEQRARAAGGWRWAESRAGAWLNPSQAPSPLWNRQGSTGGNTPYLAQHLHVPKSMNAMSRTKKNQSQVQNP